MAKKKTTPINYSKPLDNAKYERFCQEFVTDNNKTQAAIRAKYSEKTAGSKGEQLLKIVDIKERIAILQAELSKKSGITAVMVVEEFAKIAFANIQDYIKDDNEIVDLSQIKRDKAAAIDSIQVDIRHDNGDSMGYTEKVRFKLHSKISALENLGKHLGIFEKDNIQRAFVLEIR